MSSRSRSCTQNLYNCMYVLILLNVLAVKTSFSEEDRRSSGASQIDFVLGGDRTFLSLLQRSGSTHRIGHCQETAESNRCKTVAVWCPFPCIFIFMLASLLKLSSPDDQTPVQGLLPCCCKSFTNVAARTMRVKKGKEDIDRVNGNNSGSAKQSVTIE
jgi:hypothetical protein